MSWSNWTHDARVELLVGSSQHTVPRYSNGRGEQGRSAVSACRALCCSGPTQSVRWSPLGQVAKKATFTQISNWYLFTDDLQRDL